MLSLPRRRHRALSGPAASPNLATALLAAAALSLSSAAQAQEKVTIASLNWDGATAIAHVLQAVINGPLGSEAEIIQGLADQAIIWEGMDQGQGAVDVYPDLWLPAWQAHLDRYVVARKTVAVNRPYAGTERLFMPRYMAGTVQSIEDLAAPDIARLFDADGDGKGEYWAGDPDWGAAKITQIKFKSHGLGALWEPSVAALPDFLKQFKRRYAAQQPALFYYWTPEWIHSAYDLVALHEPAPGPGCADLKLDQADWLAASTLKCQIADSKVHIAYSVSLRERNPAAARFLANIRLQPAVINLWLLQIGREKQDPRAVAEAWVRDNYDTVHGWLK